MLKHPEDAADLTHSINPVVRERFAGGHKNRSVRGTPGDAYNMDLVKGVFNWTNICGYI